MGGKEWLQRRLFPLILGVSVESRCILEGAWMALWEDALREDETPFTCNCFIPPLTLLCFRRMGGTDAAFSSLLSMGITFCGGCLRELLLSSLMGGRGVPVYLSQRCCFNEFPSLNFRRQET
jgi:hypothetical protein